MPPGIIRSDYANQFSSTEQCQGGLHDAFSQAGLYSQFSYANGYRTHASTVRRLDSSFGRSRDRAERGRLEKRTADDRERLGRA